MPRYGMKYLQTFQSDTRISSHGPSHIPAIKCYVSSTEHCHSLATWATCLPSVDDVYTFQVDGQGHTTATTLHTGGENILIKRIE
jgi:hypothetical protein